VNFCPGNTTAAGFGSTTENRKTILFKGHPKGVAMNRIDQRVPLKSSGRGVNTGFSGSGTEEPGALTLLTSSLRDLLHEYRTRLAPGALYFLGKYENGNLAGIAEVHIPLAEQPDKPRHTSVLFAFFEKGYPPADIAKKGYENWQHEYPFSHDIASTSEEFRSILAAHVDSQLRKALPHAV
jgi:hypothetical protein